jgi:hypothetical protein
MVALRPRYLPWIGELDFDPIRQVGRNRAKQIDVRET